MKSAIFGIAVVALVTGMSVHSQEPASEAPQQLPRILGVLDATHTDFMWTLENAKHDTYLGLPCVSGTGAKGSSVEGLVVHVPTSKIAGFIEFDSIDQVKEWAKNNTARGK